MEFSVDDSPVLWEKLCDIGLLGNEQLRYDPCMPLPPAERLSIRLLYPFHLRPLTTREEAIERLTGARWAKSRAVGTAKELELWEASKAPKKATSELLEEASRFLFPKQDPSAVIEEDDEGEAEFVSLELNERPIVDCWLLRQAARDSFFHLAGEMAVVLNGEHEAKWRRSGAGARPVSQAFRFDKDRPVELYLLNGRVGILSIQVDVAPAGGLTGNEAQEFCYHFSHLKARMPCLRVPCWGTDPHMVERNEHAPAVAELPMTPGNFADRLGKRGQSWTLGELRDLLLGPLWEVIDVEQKQFICHSVLAYPDGVSFAGAEESREAMLLAAAMSQLEEADHAKAVDVNRQHCEVLYENHVAAYSYLGAAHLVAYQFPADRRSGTFDADRVYALQNKYAFAFLASLTQRLLCHRFIVEAIKRKRSEHAELWDAFVEFEIRGYLIDVSRREAVNRCYHLSQRAQRVRETIENLHRIFRDDQDARQTEDLGKTQDRVGQLEMFIIGFYTFEFCHKLAEIVELEHGWALAGMIGFGGVAAWIVYLHHHKHKVRYWILGTALVLAGWVALAPRAH